VQTKTESFIESCTSTAFGFVFAYAIQFLLAWAYDVEMGYDVIGWFVFWFTVASIIRGYIIRRFFDGKWWKRVFNRRSETCYCGVLVEDCGGTCSESQGRGHGNS